MAAPKGNSYYKLVKNWKYGADRKYTPSQLWDKAVEYFEWVEANPLKEQKAFSSGVTVDVSKMRAMELQGFCTYANISYSTFKNYSNNKAYLAITTRIKQIMDSQKFTGAAAGLLESNIIARDLKLVDKKEVDNKINGKPLTKDLAKKIINELK